MEGADKWPLGSATLVCEINEIPQPRKFIGALGGYYFYKTRHGEYAYRDNILNREVK